MERRLDHSNSLANRGDLSMRNLNDRQLGAIVKNVGGEAVAERIRVNLIVDPDRVSVEDP